VIEATSCWAVVQNPPFLGDSTSLDFLKVIAHPLGGSKPNSSKTVRHDWFESGSVGANERIKPQTEKEMEDVS
jgi:hypothetical protein